MSGTVGPARPHALIYRNLGAAHKNSWIWVMSVRSSGVIAFKGIVSTRQDFCLPKEGSIVSMR